MQLSKNQLIKLDLLIERYMDDNTIKEAKVIEDYLKHSPAKICDILVTVYFKLSRTPNENERKIIDKHKVKLFNLLQEKGYITYEEQRTTEHIIYENIDEKVVEQRTNSEKIEKLNRYKNLTEIVEALDDRLYLLIEKKESQSHVKAIDYSKEKTKRSTKRYEFNGMNLLSAIQETEEQLKHYISELQQERTYLLDVFDKLPCIRTSEVYRLRYIELKTWKEISEYLRMGISWCIKQHDEYIEELEL
ncbi:MAG: hypothetical protein HXM18_01130 [Gemella morbillorum]|uniref:hypothetical protein n=1 Tax=Gemella morbillorum TaxID=29391 RepID=UPI001CB02BEA|nr:hypothetical protein [Gemella morbillorum]MBF1209117.1 hypothetical protein [Gemella morbillorum]